MKRKRGTMKRSGWIVVTFNLLFFSNFSQLKAQNNKPEFSTNELNYPARYGSAFEHKFKTRQTPVFRPKQFSKNAILLENGYAASAIKNPKAWPPVTDANTYHVKSITLIYSLYPRDTAFWLTNYHGLLAARLNALFKIDPSLNNDKISWNILLQSNCPTEEDARKLFHGILIQYEPLKVKYAKKDTIKQLKLVVEKVNKDSLSAEQLKKKLARFIEEHGNDADSTTVKVFNRHPDWKNALVIMDWTGSMYAYGSQLVQWHYLNTRNNAPRYYVFFNDGNHTQDEKKIIGKTGGIYFSKATQFNEVVRLFDKVLKEGNGGDAPENDAEAILKGIHKYPDASEVVLIADNWADMRDYKLIDSIKKPVKVILCGARSNYINVQYVNLAYKTGGSLHTIEQDIESLESNKADSGIIIRNIPFILKQDGSGYTYKNKQDARLGASYQATHSNASPPKKKRRHFLWIF